MALIYDDKKFLEILSPHFEKEEEILYFNGMITTYRHLHKPYMVGISDKRIIIYPLSISGKLEEHIAILKADIKELKVSKEFFGMINKIDILLKDGSKWNFTASNKSLGIKKQKENLMRIQEISGIFKE